VSALEAAVRAVLEPHPAVESVELAGSRARGTETPLSDWDFEVGTSDFSALTMALPALVEPLEPLSRQWDRYSPHPTYMLMLRGPLKLDLLFLGRVNEPRGPWKASAETLPAIDDHFWDWILWLKSKEHRDDLFWEQLGLLHENLLRPFGAVGRPAGVEHALELYLEARGRAELVFGVRVDRALGDEVMKALR
jgi:hypothetical protein